MVTRLPSPFEKNELELWNVESLQLKLWKLYKSDNIHLNMPIKHVQEREKKIDCKKKNILLSQLLSQLQHWKNKDNIFYVNFVSSICIYFG